MADTHTDSEGNPIIAVYDDGRKVSSMPGDRVIAPDNNNPLPQPEDPVSALTPVNVPAPATITHAEVKAAIREQLEPRPAVNVLASGGISDPQPLNVAQATVTQAPPPAKTEPAAREDIAYDNAVALLTGKMKDGKLTSAEVDDLKTVEDHEKQKGGSEYAIIAAHYEKLYEAEQNPVKQDQYAAIIQKARQIDNKIQNNTLADGELTKLTGELLGKIEKKPETQQINAQQLAINPPLTTQQMQRIVKMDSDRGFSPPQTDDLMRYGNATRQPAFDPRADFKQYDPAALAKLANDYLKNTGGNTDRLNPELAKQFEADAAPSGGHKPKNLDAPIVETPKDIARFT